MSPRFDKWDRGKAVDLTEEDSFCSKYGGYRCYRNSAKKKSYMGNRQKATEVDFVVQEAIPHAYPLKNRFAVSSAQGTRQIDLAKNNPDGGPELGSKLPFKTFSVGPMSDIRQKKK